MQMHVAVHVDGSLHRQSIDKASVLPFDPVRSIMAVANRPAQAGNAVVLGQLLPAVCLNSSFDGVVGHLYRTLCTCKRNGFSVRALHALVHRKLKHVDFSGLTAVHVGRAWRCAVMRASRDHA